MVKASDRVYYPGTRILLDRLTYERLMSLNQLVRSKAFGGERSNITLIQGIGGAAASGGTHVAGGCWDITAFNQKFRILGGRLLGGADWYRKAIPGVWQAHIHGVTAGLGYIAAAARRQVTAYWNGRNGLANNGRDDGPEIWGKPLFVAPWTSRGRRGVYYAKRGTTMRQGSATRSPSRGSLPKDGKFTVIGVVNNEGKLWAINVDGKHALMSDLTMTKPKAPSKPTPVKPPLPTQPKAVTINFGTLNVIRWRLTKDGKDYRAPNGAQILDVKKGKDYSDRLPGLAKLRYDMGVSVLATQEAGQYADADALDKAMGDADWANRLHGDNAGDLTQAIHRHKKRTEVEGGRFTTKGSHHNTGTWSLLKDETGSKVYALVVTTHTDHRARGTKDASTWDLLREDQTESLIEQAEAKAAELEKKYDIDDLPILFGGDWNSDRDDVYDGPGRAMAKAGYVDAADIAKAHEHTEWTTLNGLKTTPFKGRRLDRWFVKVGAQVNSIRTYWGAPNTDHNGVAIEAVLDNV